MGTCEKWAGPQRFVRSIALATEPKVKRRADRATGIVAHGSNLLHARHQVGSDPTRCATTLGRSGAIQLISGIRTRED